jgi:hypothetical protein
MSYLFGTSAASTLKFSPISLTGGADAIDPHTAASYMVNTVGVDAMTIVAPTSGTDDGKVIQITTGTTGTPTLTCTGGTLRPGTAAVTTVLFAASPGSTVVLMAYQGLWYVIAANNVTYA